MLRHEGEMWRRTVYKLSSHFVVSADEEVTGGVIAINLKIDGIQFYNENLDLCDAALQAGLNCPLSVGAHTLNINQEIPDEAPPVSHRV